MAMYILFLLLVFFVPFPPAYFIYTKLPSEIIVRGPFKGFNIDLTGAFGGYFLLVLLALGFAYFALTPAKPHLEIWRVTGRIQTKSTDPNTADVSDNFAGTEINTKPETFLVDSEGKFEIRIAVMPDDIESTRKLKGLEFIRDGYGKQVLSLDTVSRIVTKDEKTITFKHPIVLTKLKDEELPTWNR